MKHGEEQILIKTNEFIEILDSDIEHLDRVMQRFSELRTAVIKRDEKSLTAILENIRLDSEIHTRNESIRQEIRKQLSELINCQFKEVTLTKLEAILPREMKIRLRDKKMVIMLLTDRMKKEYAYTAKLLNECTRLNSIFLNLILNRRNDNITYNACGDAKTHSETALINMHL